MLTSSLIDSLTYAPVELAFGTSGLRGLVRDITSLEAYINASAFLCFCLRHGRASPGGSVCIAGDLRPSTTALVAEAGGRGEILQAVARAVADAGMQVEYLGRVPTPALMLYAVRRHRPSIMVTGSHIPFDRNGIKFNTPSGEISKQDEGPILEEVRRVRAEEYRRPRNQSIFDEGGMLRPPIRAPLPRPAPAASREYVRRYLDSFARDMLAGRRIIVWQHSAVGRDLVVEILEGLGAEVLPAGRSDEFVAVDTEAIGAQTLELLQALLDSAGGRVDALLSTDGDGDRPLLLAVERGRATFIPGDLLGIVTAELLGARHVALPISANDAVDAHLAPRGVEIAKTRIGSPHVIAAMREVGWEANGGFLTAVPLGIPGGGILDPLPTRDAMLPLLAALRASLGSGQTLGQLFAHLPPRHSSSAVLRSFPRERSEAILAMLAPPPAVEEAHFEGDGVHVAPPGGGVARWAGPEERRRLGTVKATLERFFDSAAGFPRVERVNWLDGVRVRFANGDIAHLRPSGNAPELRLYAVAGERRRALEITRLATSERGILRRMEREARPLTAAGNGG